MRKKVHLLPKININFQHCWFINNNTLYIGRKYSNISVISIDRSPPKLYLMELFLNKLYYILK